MIFLNINVSLFHLSYWPLFTLEMGSVREERKRKTPTIEERGWEARERPKSERISPGRESNQPRSTIKKLALSARGFNYSLFLKT